jgi:hypothetical protein
MRKVRVGRKARGGGQQGRTCVWGGGGAVIDEYKGGVRGIDDSDGGAETGKTGMLLMAFGRPTRRDVPTLMDENSDWYGVVSCPSPTRLDPEGRLTCSSVMRGHG